MSYTYKYTYPKSLEAVGYSGPTPINSSDKSYSAGIADTNDIRDLIRASIERILGTSQGERVMQPRFGANLRKLLFEPMDNFLMEEIKENILDTLSEQEPRISITNIEFEPNIDEHTIYIAISYNLKNKLISDTFNFTIR